MTGPRRLTPGDAAPTNPQSRIPNPCSHDHVLRPAVRRRRHRRRHRVRDLLATGAGAPARPPPGCEGAAGRWRLPQARRAVVAVQRSLSICPRSAVHRPGHPRARGADGDRGRAGPRRPAVAAVDRGGAVSAAGMRDQWWLASLGRTVVWARLRVREGGTAEIFDSDGNTLGYDSEDTARAMLMDAEFVSFDGLDEEDALERGFSLAELTPPTGSDDTLRPRMVQKLGGSA